MGEVSGVSGHGDPVRREGIGGSGTWLLVGSCSPSDIESGVEGLSQADGMCDVVASQICHNRVCCYIIWSTYLDGSNTRIPAKESQNSIDHVISRQERRRSTNRHARRR